MTATAPEAGAQGLKRPYVLVLGLLAIVTVAEVQIPTIGRTLALAASTIIVLLMVSSIAKASLVALYYMHLRYELRVLRLLPLGPLAFVALLILVVVLD